MVGRKLAARALSDVGETSVVLRSRNSSAWTMTAYRAPPSSWPRAFRGAGSRKISPRTISVCGLRGESRKFLADKAHLRAVDLICCESAYLVSHCRAQPPTSRRFTQSSTHGLPVGETSGAHDLECRGRRFVRSNVERTSHPTVAWHESCCRSVCSALGLTTRVDLSEAVGKGERVEIDLS
jgi:hypothetical protein